MAWRNIWRNKTRSILVMLSVIIGLWAGLFTMAFVQGMYLDHMKDTIVNYLSNLQVHHKDFSQERDIGKTITVTKSRVAALNNDPRVKGASPRLIVQVMISSPVNALGVNAMGIMPYYENKTTGLSQKLAEGSTLQLQKKNGILMSQKLASRLKVKLKNKVVLSFQDVNGDIVSGTFRIAGIFTSGNSTFDEANVYVLAHHLQ